MFCKIIKGLLKSLIDYERRSWSLSTPKHHTKGPLGRARDADRCCCACPLCPVALCATACALRLWPLRPAGGFVILLVNPSNRFCLSIGAATCAWYEDNTEKQWCVSAAPLRRKPDKMI